VTEATVTLTIPAKTEYLVVARLALAGIARAVPFDESALADLKLAVTEACGNAVRHARPAADSVVRVGYALDGDAIQITVEDEGPGPAPVVPPAMPRPDALAGELPEGGLGLALIDALVDEVEIRGREGGPGTLVLMRKRLIAPGPTKQA
jgi:serine/threonine-protein kinase RsbW